MSNELSESDESVLGAIQFATGTDIGRRREENQDSYGVITAQDYRFYIVADGMGGVKGGAEASRLAIDVFSKELSDVDQISPSIISDALAKANSKIFNTGQTKPAFAGMGTTFVGLAFTDARMFIINVGDSRVYRLRAGEVKQLTQDHTLVEDLIRAGTITADQAENHPVSHMLTRSLGPTEEVEVDCWEDPYGPARGDRYLLCSDGLYNMVHDDELAALIATKPLEEAVSDCINLANERGGTDNITVIILEIGEDYPLSIEDFPAEIENESDTQEVEIEPLSISSGKAGDQQRLIEALKQNESVADFDDSDASLGSAKTEKFERSDIASPLLEEGVDIGDIHHSVSGAHEPNEELSQEERHEEGEEKEQESSHSFRILSGIVIAIGVFASVLLFAYFQRLSSSGENQELYQGGRVVKNSQEAGAPREFSAIVARESLANSYDQNKQSLNTPLIAGLSLLSKNESISLPAKNPDNLAPGSAIITDEEFDEVPAALLEDLSARKIKLVKHISKLKQSIAAFDTTPGADINEKLNATRQKSEKVLKELETTRAELDMATRRLAVWYGRQKRLERSSGINLAGEVAVSSDSVKEYKEIFERASWEYLKEAEVLRYNPNDKAQKEKVAKLTSLRKQRMIELSEAVREAINKAVSEADHKITELTLRRDRLESELELLRREKEYFQVLLSSNQDARKAKREELERELAISRQELQELEKL